jgi:maltokinase
MQGLEELLPPWMVRQRWYAGKGRVPMLRRIGVVELQRPAADVDIKVHLLLDESGQSPTIYQVPLTYRGIPLAGADHALLATVDRTGPGGDVRHGTRYVYDAPHDPVFATALLQLMLQEGTATSDGSEASCVAHGHRVATSGPGKVVGSRVLTGEQSNTSIILDLVDDLGIPSKPLICKVFRVLHHGENPDVVVQSALAAAGSTRVPQPIGHVTGQWPDAATPDGRARGHQASSTPGRNSWANAR